MSQEPRTEVCTTHNIYGSTRTPAELRRCCAGREWVELRPGGTSIRVADIVHFRPWPT